ncbi:MAG: peptidoglycan-binding domain-containing protein [Spartobacteria bacterium]
MKKFITVIISCSLALAAGAMAQQDEATPGKKKHKQQEKAEANSQAQPGSAPHSGMKAKEQRAERRNARADAAANAPDAAPGKAKAKMKARAEAQTSAPDSAAATSDVSAQAGQRRKGRNAVKADETATATETTAAGSPAPSLTKKEARAKARMERQAATAPQANQPNAGNAQAKGKVKQLDTQTVKKIKAQHANFKAQPRPQQIPAVSFTQSRTIEGSQNWQGENYSVFRSYRPERHDQSYYRSRYSRIELISGGYYYFNNGYWYPAWGYQPTAQYYVYDGPIYAGRSAVRLDRVIADVQAALQAQGYYRGEVDGLLGPLTREALTGYQSDHGLYTTAAIDEPTLNSLGMN